MEWIGLPSIRFLAMGIQDSAQSQSNLFALCVFVVGPHNARLYVLSGEQKLKKNEYTFVCIT